MVRRMGGDGAEGPARRSRRIVFVSRRGVAMASSSKFDFEFGAGTDARGAWDEDDIPDELEAFPLTSLSLGMWKARSHGGLRAVLGRERFVFVVFRRRRAVPTLAARASELVSQQLGRHLQIPVPSSPFDLGDASTRRASRAFDAALGDADTPRSPRGATPAPDVPATPPIGTRDAPRASTAAADDDDAPSSATTTTTTAFTPGAASAGAPAHASGFRAAQHVVLTYEITFEDVVGLDYINPLCFDGRVAIEARRVTKRAFSNLASALAFFRRRDGTRRGTGAETAARFTARRSSNDRRANRPEHANSNLNSNADADADARRGGGEGSDVGGGGTARKRSRLALESRFAEVASIPGGDDRTAGDFPGTKTGTGTGTGLRVRTVASRSPGTPGTGTGTATEGVFSPPARGVLASSSSSSLAWDDDSEGGHPGVVFRDRTVQAHFADPHLPDALRARVRARPALLRLCETGLPPWAIFLAGYGFFYRPYLRAVARYLFLLVSSLSMLAGFYDLYKHIPGADVVLSGMWSPFTQFLENHARARLSILASYLFTQSAIFAPLVTSVAATARAGLAPLAGLAPSLFAARGVGRTAASASRFDLGVWRELGATTFRSVKRIVDFLLHLLRRAIAHRISLGMEARRRGREVHARLMRAHGFEEKAGMASPRTPGDRARARTTRESPRADDDEVDETREKRE